MEIITGRLKMTNLEQQLKERGYKLVDEQQPFRIYEKHTKRLIYHIGSGKVWGGYRVKINQDTDED